MLKLRFLALVMGLALIATFGLAGCKNTCQKATDHMKNCVEEYCADREDDPMCEALQQETDAEVPECTDEFKAQAEELLSKSCDEIFGTGE